MSARGRRRRFADRPPGQRAGIVALATVQLSLAVTAWVDLARRPRAEVNGGKLPWALMIAVNWLGPLAWFRWGRQRAR